MADEHQNPPPDEFTSLAEWIKFAALVVTIIGTLLVISLLKPWIFGRVIPSVLGWDALSGQLVDPVPDEPNTVDPAIEEAVVAPVDNDGGEAAAEPASEGEAAEQSDGSPAETAGDQDADPAAVEQDPISESAGEEEPGVMADMDPASTETEEAAAGETTEADAPADSAAAEVSSDEAPQSYVVLPGDTLYEIANRFGLTVEALMAANPQIVDLNAIRAGQTLQIPSP